MNGIDLACRGAIATASDLQAHWFAAPLAAAIYPWLLVVFHDAAKAIERGEGTFAWIGAGLALATALAMPAIAFRAALRLGRIPEPSAAELAARRTALMAVTAPPMFTLVGVGPLLLGHPDWDIGFLLRLAWRWNARPMDAARTLQVAGGVFLVWAVISHLNAVLYLARVHFGIDTDRGFAIGAPTDMLLDPWNIRLLPYYLGGVFFVVAHAFCGLRIVMLAHQAPRASADRVLAIGIVFAALLATTIILAMCGLRLHFAA